MSDHTPGPWKLEQHGLDEVTVVGDDGWHVGYWPDNIRERANARIIAAAPELLEEAENVLREYGHMMEAHDAEYLQDAINKAQGG